jgi:signal transduction histidine kinase
VPRHEQLKDAVARTLGDPSVEVGFWSKEAGRYLTAEGRTLELPHEGGGRATTLLEQHGEPLAAIVHDPALLDDPVLVDAVGAATRLAVQNERLQAEVRAQLEEVRASRARIVEAGDAERRRVERNLHDGAQQRLVTLSLVLAEAQTRLGPAADPELASGLQEAAEELRRALAELRELARGIHPAILTEDGLVPALESLAQNAPVPIKVTAAVDGRFAPAVEATAYFVVSEALTNVAKYAQAHQVRINVGRTNGQLTVEVSDDGVGGADPGKGSGLRGLADRVAAVDGRLQVDSPAGEGTRIAAAIPCA